MPCHAAEQQEPEATVVEVAEAMTDPTYLLDEQVDGFGAAVGQPLLVAGEHLGLPGGDGLGQPADVGDIDLGAPGGERHQRPGSSSLAL